MTRSAEQLFPGCEHNQCLDSRYSDQLTQAQMILLLPGAWALGEGLEIEMPSPAAHASSSAPAHCQQCGNGCQSYCAKREQPHPFSHHFLHHDHGQPLKQQQQQQSLRLPPCPRGDRRRRSCHTGADLCHDGGAAAASTSAPPPPPGTARRHSCQGLDAAPSPGCSPFLVHAGGGGGSGGSSHAGSEPLSTGLLRIASSFTSSVTGYLSDLVAWTTAEHPPMSPIARHHATAAAAAAGAFGADGSPGTAAAAAAAADLSSWYADAMLLPIPGAEAAEALSVGFSGGVCVSSSGVGREADVSSGGGWACDGSSSSGGAAGAGACSSPRGSSSGPVPRSRPGAASAGGQSVGGAAVGVAVVGAGATGAGGLLCGKKDA